MMHSPSKKQKLVLTGISVTIGFGIKQLMKKFWIKRYSENPPDLKSSRHLQWGKLILWSIMTGLILRIIKIAIKRSLAIAIEKNNLLT